MATKFLDLDGLKYFKTKQDAANDGKWVPQGITINGVALNKTGITITDDTKLSKTDATSIYLTKTDAAKTYLGIAQKHRLPARPIRRQSWQQHGLLTELVLTVRQISQSTQQTAQHVSLHRSSARQTVLPRSDLTKRFLPSTSPATLAKYSKATTAVGNFTKNPRIRR